MSCISATPDQPEYLIPLGLSKLVIVRTPGKYRSAKLWKALTQVAHHYGNRQKDIHYLDPLTHDFKPCSDETMAKNAEMRSALNDAYSGKSQKYRAFELWNFDGEAATLIRQRLPET